MRSPTGIASLGFPLAIALLVVGLVTSCSPAIAQAVCDDGNPCTDDTVDPITSECRYRSDDSNSCNDGLSCTAHDVCRAGECVSREPMDCVLGNMQTYSSGTILPMPIGTVVTSTIQVSTSHPILWKVRARTYLIHGDTSGLDVTLRSPSGTIVTLTTGNPESGLTGEFFQSTLWDDNANPSGPFPYNTSIGIVTDHPYSSGTDVPQLTPEEPLGAFAGEDPNGTWTLSLLNRTDPEASLDGWFLELWTHDDVAISPEQEFESTTSVPVPANMSRNSTISVSGLGSVIWNVSVTLAITQHTGADVALISPSGTTVTLSTDNGCLQQGRTLQDDADPGGAIPSTGQNLINDCDPSSGPVPVLLAPEEPLSALRGEPNPNGTWILRVRNGSFLSAQIIYWTLRISTATCTAVFPLCNDNNPCTDETCDESGDCSSTPDDTNSCSDGNPCTTDACVTGTCVNVPDDANSCTDGNACTADTCVSGACVSTALTCGTGACVSNLCNTDSGCLPPNCDDGFACTTDSCDPAIGCVHTPNSGACDDVNPCTDDACTVGSGCVHTNDDTNTCAPNQCHVWQCDSGQCQQGASLCTDGSCYNSYCNGFACYRVYCHENGNDCTNSCLAGGGCGPRNCDDGNICTADSCQLRTWHDGYCLNMCQCGQPSPVGLSVSHSAGVATVSWESAGTGAAYDVLRGDLLELPVGPDGGDTLEACLGDETSELHVEDEDLPTAGTGFWYLVRSNRFCGFANYGYMRVDASHNAERYSNTCP